MTKCDSLISLKGPSPRSHGGNHVGPLPASNLQHGHLPNQLLPLHPGANCPTALLSPAQCVISPRRAQAPPPPSQWQPPRFSPRFGASGRPPPNLTSGAAPGIPTCRSETSQTKRVAQGCIRGSAEAPLPSKGAVGRENTEPFFFLCGLILRNASLPLTPGGPRKTSP